MYNAISRTDFFCLVYFYNPTSFAFLKRHHYTTHSQPFLSIRVISAQFTIARTTHSFLVYTTTSPQNYRDYTSFVPSFFVFLLSWISNSLTSKLHHESAPIIHFFTPSIHPLTLTPSPPHIGLFITNYFLCILLLSCICSTCKAK